MRVLLLGPVVSENTSGGVAVYTEGVYQGFKSIGDDVEIISIEKSKAIENDVVKVYKSKPSNILFNFGKIAKEIKKFKPDLVISSLQYSLGIKKYKKYYPNAKYVQVLHGFPCQINGVFKAKKINLAAKYSRKHFDYVITVSFLSYGINKKINQIPCDKIIYNGCNFPVSSIKQKRIYDFVYIGRLFKDKEVEMIANAFAKAKKTNPNLKLAIAGYGELESLFLNGKHANSGIAFLGKLTQEEVKETLCKSRFFISMNPLEPFGIVFSEALLCGCNIVTQSTSGCAPLYIKKDYFHIADCINSIELSERLLEIEKKFYEISNSDLEEISNYSSYKRVAQDFKALLKSKNN